MTKKQFIVAYRLAFAAVVAVAVAAQLAHSMQRVQDFNIINFFSFFTIEANLFGAVIFLMSAYALRQGKKDRQLESLRGAATLYMLITGIVYGLFLVDAEVQNSVAWSNTVLHYVFPLVVLFDWLYDQTARKFTDKQALAWLVFPVAYLAYSLIRGPLANDWYPYPFLDVADNGLGRVILNSVAIGLGALILALVIARLPEFTKPKKSPKN